MPIGGVAPVGRSGQPLGTYFFGVQSIDAAFEGSAFSNEANAFVIRIDGSLNVCKGSDFNYVAKPAGSYTWQVTGGTIVSGQGTDALVVNWNTTGRGYIRVSNSQNAKSTLGVSINEKPKPVIEGDATVCTGIEHYFIADQDTRFTEWAVEGGNSILEDTTHQVKIDWTSPGDHKLIAKAYSDHRGKQRAPRSWQPQTLLVYLSPYGPELQTPMN